MTYNTPSQPTKVSKKYFRAKWHDYYAPGYYMLTITTGSRKSEFGELTGDNEQHSHINYNPLGMEMRRLIFSTPALFPEISIEELIVMEDHCHIFLKVKTQMKKHLGHVVSMLKKKSTTFYIHQLNMAEGCIHLTQQTDKHEAEKQSKRLNTAITEAQAILRGKVITCGEAIQRGEAITCGETAYPQAPDYSKPAPSLAEEIAMIYSLSRSTPLPASPSPSPSQCGSASQCQCGSAAQSPCGSASQCLCGSAAPLPIKYIPPLWSPGYHDRIVRKVGQAATLRRYIRRNPARLWLKRHSNRNYTQVTPLNIPLPLPLAQRLKDTALYWDCRYTLSHSTYTPKRDGTFYADNYLQLTQKFLRINRETNTPFLRFLSCGNQNLLNSGRPLVRVRLSRSITEEQFTSEADRILTLCEQESAILISPFLSWSEKELLHLAILNGYDFIVLHANSMSTLWKPSDASICTHSQKTPPWFSTFRQRNNIPSTITKDIDLTYQGHALFIAPWHDRPEGDHPGKADCEIMNETCKVIEIGVNGEG